jgi:hypothetical protein
MRGRSGLARERIRSVVVEDYRDGFPALILVAVGGCTMVAVGLTAAMVVVSVNVYTAHEFNGKDAFWFFLTLPAVGLVALAWGAVGMLRGSVRGAHIAAETLRERQGILYLITAFLGLGHLIDPGSAMLAGGVSVAASATLLILVHISRHLVVRCEPLMIRR